MALDLIHNLNLHLTATMPPPISISARIKIVSKVFKCQVFLSSRQAPSVAASGA